MSCVLNSVISSFQHLAFSHSQGGEYSNTSYCGGLGPK